MPPSQLDHRNPPQSHPPAFYSETETTHHGQPDRRERPQHIVIIDDDVLVCDSLRSLLGDSQHNIQVFHDGSDAVLASIRDNPPDLVVTDVELPSRSGIQICDAVRDFAETRDVPIIVITAHTERSIRLQAIEHGATDFLLKPFDEEEVALRISNAIRSYRLLKETAATLERLRQVEQMREELAGLVVHDLRAPIGSVRNYLELWLLKSCDPPGSTLRQYIEVAFAQTGAVIDQIGTLLDVSRLEASAMPLIVRSCSIHDVFERVRAAVGAAALRRNVSIDIDHGGHSGRIDVDLVVRAITNLAANAVRFAPGETSVMLSCRRATAGRIRISVQDQGPGIPEALHAKLFTKFGTVEGRSRGYHSTGFGLYMCALVAKAHDGAVGYEQPPEGGSRFWLELPEPEAAPAAALRAPGQPAESALDQLQR